MWAGIWRLTTRKAEKARFRTFGCEIFELAEPGEKLYDFRLPLMRTCAFFPVSLPAAACPAGGGILALARARFCGRSA